MKIDIITLFPGMFAGPFEESIIKRAKKRGLVKIKIHNLRKWAKDTHKTVDDKPYGGGAGMVLMVQPIFDALESLKSEARNPKSKIKKSKVKGQRSKVILLTPQGKVFNQEKARELSTLKHLILISGHYEGFDERIREHLVDEEISIGDYVLTGGELPAMVVVDVVVRLIPGVLGKRVSLSEESHSTPGYIEYPQYTRPENYRGWKVPEVLLSGNHAEIARWRMEQAKKRTRQRRPDLLQ